VGFWGIPIAVQSRPTNPINTDVSTVDTIHQMIEIARVSSHSPKISSVVDSLIRSLPRNPSQLDLARAIFWWIKNHISFRQDEDILSMEMGYRDPLQELLIPADTLLSMPVPQGDCDDFSMLAATLMLASKIPVWYVAVAVDPVEPERFSHVYNKVLVDGEYLPFDSSHGMTLGWETKQQVFRRMEWFVG
jgi:hypothetical protein